MRNHDRFVKVFKGRKGREFSTAEIKRLMFEEYPDLPEGSNLPNEHGGGNLTSCKCVGTESQIFDHIARGQYRVLEFV
jgi:hypothetical protein